MLLPNRRLAGKYEHTQQVCASHSGDEVFCTTGVEPDCAPACPVKNPVNLLTREDWLRVAKKYRLSNVGIRKMRRFWTLSETEVFQTENPREQFAFQELEELMLRKMRRHYKAKRGTKLITYHDPTPTNDSVSNHMLVGNTSCGKTTYLNKLLTVENNKGDSFAKNRDIICFSCNPEDPSLAPARKKHKKKWTQVDYSKIDGNLSVDMLPAGCLCIFDDCLEQHNDPRSRVMYDLITQICTTGRHHKKRGGRGVECLVITHRGSDRRLAVARQACRYLTVFPSSSKLQCIHMLKNRLHMTKKEIVELLDKVGRGSRHITFDMHFPSKVMSEHTVRLLD